VWITPCSCRKACLAKLDPGEVYAELGEGVILLFWARPGDFCHRHLVAEWFEEMLGAPVPELERKAAHGRRDQENYTI